MPQRDTSGIGERIPRELIDADFSVAFSLVEMAQDESRKGNAQLASQLLEKAERMLYDIHERLLRMTVAQKEAFEPRCDGLSEVPARILVPPARVRQPRPTVRRGSAARRDQRQSAAHSCPSEQPCRPLLSRSLCPSC